MIGAFVVVVVMARRSPTPLHDVLVPPRRPISRPSLQENNTAETGAYLEEAVTAADLEKEAVRHCRAPRETRLGGGEGACTLAPPPFPAVGVAPPTGTGTPRHKEGAWVPPVLLGGSGNKGELAAAPHRGPPGTARGSGGGETEVEVKEALRLIPSRMAQVLRVGVR